MMPVAMTLLTCVCLVLLVVVIIVERRLRAVEERRSYNAQTIIPCASLKLTSHWYTLFSIPPSHPSCVGRVSLVANCTSTESTAIHITVHGTGPEPITVYQASEIQQFDLCHSMEFDVVCPEDGTVMFLRIQTSNPGPHIQMSDIIVTLILD